MLHVEYYHSWRSQMSFSQKVEDKKKKSADTYQTEKNMQAL